HNAVADETRHTRMHDARRDQAQNGFLAVDPQRMAGVVTALKAHHALDGFRQPVDDLAFTFVTPLGADHHYVLAHCTNRYRVSREIRKSPCGPLATRGNQFYNVRTTQLPSCKVSSRSQMNSSWLCSWPGSTCTTISPECRS